MPLKAESRQGHIYCSKKGTALRSKGVMGKAALLRVVQEQQETIEKQSRLIADLVVTLESWENAAGYDGAELKERALNLQRQKGRIYGNEDHGIYQHGGKQ